MPLIDERGRLGGKVNILDAAVAAVLALALVLWGVSGRARPTDVVKDSRITIVVDSEPVYPGADDIRVGEKAFLFNGSTSFELGTITKVEVQPYPSRAPLPDGRIVVAPDPVQKLVRLTIEGQGSASPNLITMQGQAMLVGYRFRLRTPRTDFLVAVRDIQVQPLGRSS